MNYSLERKPVGLSASALRIWGILFIVLGVGGSAIIQNGMLGMSNTGGTALVEKLQDPNMMAAATVAMVLQAVYACATPIFAFLLVESFRHTGSVKNYLLRLAGLAVVSEIPYNLAMGGQWIVMSSRNPVFGMVIGLIILYFYRRYSEKSGKNLGVKALVTVAALLWVSMLRIDDGIPMVILVAVLWALRDKGMLRLLGGCSAAFVCMLTSPFYLAASFSFLPIHFYNEERGAEGKLGKYLAYPVLLLIIGLAAKYFFP